MAMGKGGLGKGLDALFPSNVNVNTLDVIKQENVPIEESYNITVIEPKTCCGKCLSNVD